MGKKRMPKSLRKFIRKEKARIRSQVLDIKEQEKLISEIYQEIKRDTNNTNEHTNDTNRNKKTLV